MENKVVLNLLVEKFSTRTQKTVAAGVLALLALTGSAFATPITNAGPALLNIGNGSIFVNGNGRTTGCLDWYNISAPGGCQPEGTTGTFTVQGGSSAPFVSGQPGTITDLNFNTPLPLVNFLQVGTPVVSHFDLTGLRFNNGGDIGDCTTAVGVDGLSDTSPGATCTPSGSPFQLANGLANAQGGVDTVSITLSLDAWGYTGTSGTNYSDATRYVGVFTTQGALQGFNIESILATIRSGGAITASWSATLSPLATSPVPEPGTYLLFGLGLISVASVRRRTRKG